MVERLGFEILVDDKGTPTIKEFIKTVEDTGSSAQQAEGLFKNLTSSLGATLKQAAILGGTLLGLQTGFGILKAGVSALRSFQTALADAGTQGVSSSAQLAQIREELLQLPPSLGSSTELAKGLYAALSGGIPAGEAVKFVGEAAVFAKANVVDLGEGVDSIIKVLSGFQLAASEASRVTDILSKASEFGQFQAREFGRNLTVVIPQAKALGVSLEETAGVTAALSKGFPSLTQAATGFRSALGQLILNSEKFRDIGIDVSEVISERGVVGLFKLLKERVGASAEAIRPFIGDTEGLNAALQLMGPLAENAAAATEALGNAAGSTAEKFKQQQATFDASLATFQNTLERIVQKSGPAFLDTLSSILKSIEGGIEPAIQFATDTWDLFRFTLAATRSVFADIIGGLSTAAAAVTRFGASIAEFFGARGAAQSLREYAATLDGVARQWHEVADEHVNAAQRIALGTDRIVEGARKAAIAQGVLPDAFKAVGEAGEKMAGTVAAAQANVAATAADTARRTEVVWVASITKIGDTWTQTTRQMEREAHSSTDAINSAFADLGIKTIGQLQTALDTTVARFARVLESGQATAAGLQKAYDALAKDAIARYGTLPPAFEQVHQALLSGNAEAAGRFLAQWDDGAKKSAATLAEHFQRPVEHTVAAVTQTFQAGTEAWVRANEDAAHRIGDIWGVGGEYYQLIVNAQGELEKIEVDSLGRRVRANKEAADVIATAHTQAAQKIKSALDFATNSAASDLASLRSFVDEFNARGGPSGPVVQALPGDTTTIEGITERIGALYKRIADLRRSQFLTPTQVAGLIKPYNTAITELYQTLLRLQEEAGKSTEALQGVADAANSLGGGSGASGSPGGSGYLPGQYVGQNGSPLTPVLAPQVPGLGFAPSYGPTLSPAPLIGRPVDDLRNPQRPTAGAGTGPLYTGDSLAIGIPDRGGNLPPPGIRLPSESGGSGGVLLPPTIVLRIEAGAVQVQGREVDARSLTNDFVRVLTTRLEEEQRRGRLRVGG